MWALGYDAGDSLRFRKDLGWDRRTARDEDSMIDADNSRETMRLKASDLSRNNAIVAGLRKRFDTFFVGSGVRPQARTVNPTWNTAAEEFWQQYAGACDIRQQCDLRDLQGMSVSLTLVQGGLYFELLDNGQIRPIECERIRQPQNATEAKDFRDGVRTDPKTGIILGYKVHSRDADGGFGGKHEEVFIPRENIFAVINPPWRPDQLREVPDLAEVIPTLIDIHEGNTYTLNTMKNQSMVIAALEKQGGGGVQSQARGAGAPAVGQRQIFPQVWGQIHELCNNEKLALLASPTPGATHIPYLKFQTLLVASALNLPYEFCVLDFSPADFSRMKGILTVVNRVRRAKIDWLNRRFNQRLWNWRIAKAMKWGELAPAPVDARGISEWFKVDWQGDEEITVDRKDGNEADRTEWQLGLGPLSNAARRRGGDIENLLREKGRIKALARDIEKELDLPEGSLIQDQVPGQTVPGAQDQTNTPPKGVPPDEPAE
jgi:capsid protein